MSCIRRSRVISRLTGRLPSNANKSRSGLYLQHNWCKYRNNNNRLLHGRYITTYQDTRRSPSDMGATPSIERMIMVMSSVRFSYCSQRLYASYTVGIMCTHKRNGDVNCVLANDDTTHERILLTVTTFLQASSGSENFETMSATC